MTPWLVDVIETDELGWNPRLKETQEFKSEDDAKRFVKEHNKEYRQASSTTYLVARQPREKKPLETKSKIDKITEKDNDQV